MKKIFKKHLQVPLWEQFSYQQHVERRAAAVAAIMHDTTQKVQHTWRPRSNAAACCTPPWPLRDSTIVKERLQHMLKAANVGLLAGGAFRAVRRDIARRRGRRMKVLRS